MYFVERCLIRRERVPIIPCDQCKCDWYVRDGSYNNCFWVLANAMHNTPTAFTFAEIAELEGITPKEAEDLYESAIVNLRKKVLKMSINSNES